MMYCLATIHTLHLQTTDRRTQHCSTSAKVSMVNTIRYDIR